VGGVGGVGTAEARNARVERLTTRSRWVGARFGRGVEGLHSMHQVERDVPCTSPDHTTHGCPDGLRMVEKHGWTMGGIQYGPKKEVWQWHVSLDVNVQQR